MHCLWLSLLFVSLSVLLSFIFLSVYLNIMYCLWLFPSLCLSICVTFFHFSLWLFEHNVLFWLFLSLCLFCFDFVFFFSSIQCVREDYTVRKRLPYSQQISASTKVYISNLQILISKTLFLLLAQQIFLLFYNMPSWIEASTHVLQVNQLKLQSITLGIIFL